MLVAVAAAAAAAAAVWRKGEQFNFMNAN